MAMTLVVVDDLKDWAPYFPSRDIVSFNQYMALPEKPGRVRVINCCRNTRTLGRGYYCSLLAEARGHHVIPSVQVLNDLRRKSLWSLELASVKSALDQLRHEADTSNEIKLRICFGEVANSELTPLARQLFERFPTPLLDVELHFSRTWKIKTIKTGSLASLSNEAEQELFADALNNFSNRLWRKPKVRTQYRYDLAMLVDPTEPMPPSDEQALCNFTKAGKRLGINVQRVTRRDYQRLAEFDGLFIRATTAIDHHTYRFARKAEAEGLVVMDDPRSILRCTNKVYLADLLRTNKVPTPNTMIVSDSHSSTLKEIVTTLGFPVVLKIPDGAFSRGMVRASNLEELKHGIRELRQHSSLVLAQEFTYTEYDWRIGVLNNKPLFACRYFMVKDHWQIYQHGQDSSSPDSGAFDAPAIWEVPHKVLDVALKAARLIGDGFYGVDIKQSGERVMVIEVNDNPSIDSQVEDLELGQALYHEILAEFLRRMELRR